MRSTLVRVLLIFLAAAATVARGQNILLVEHGGKMLPVVQASKTNAMVKVNDKLKVADGRSFSFHKVDEFLPLFVSVGSLKVSTHALELMSTGSQVNHEFRFRASFDSPYTVKDAFLVLRLHLADGSKMLFLHDIGTLTPHHPRTLDLAVPLGLPLGDGNYSLHIFSDGFELLQSEQPFAARERALDHIVARRIKGLPDGPPRPLLGPPPEFPRSFRKAKQKATVTVHCTIGANGAVTDPVVKSAADSELGDAAIAALRQWRFIPRLKGGRPMATAVDLPLDFEPPEKS